MIPLLLQIVTQKRVAVIAGLILLVLNVMVYVFTIRQETAIETIRSKSTELRRRVSIEGRNDASAVYRQGKAELLKLKGKIPVKREFPRVLAGILDAAESNSVIIGAVTYMPKELKGEKLLYYDITMSVNGKYGVIKSFLADLQAIDELVFVESMTMNNQDPYEESVTMDIHVTVFLQGEGA